VHRQAMPIEVEKRRCSIQHHQPPSHFVSRRHQPIGPWIKEWDPSGTPFRCRYLKILQTPQDFGALVAQRDTKHPIGGKENSLKITGGNGLLRGVFQRIRGLGHCKTAPSLMFCQLVRKT
jgi:hypothetical protein